MTDTVAFFQQYDELADAIVTDERPNVQVGTEMSNADMTEAICELLDVEFFDLFNPIDYTPMYNRGSMSQVLGYCYLAYLSWELWRAAGMAAVGDVAYNAVAAAYHELWYLRMRDRYNAHYANVETKHTWLN